MMRKDDFDYAIENTQVILAPEHQIATFGTTSFHFYLISELMDRVDQVRIRNGKIHAERPQILTPEHFSRLLLVGFGLLCLPSIGRSPQSYGSGFAILSDTSSPVWIGVVLIVAGAIVFLGS